MLSSQLKRIPNSNMLSLDKIGLVCMAIVGFQLSKFVLKVFYRTVIAPQIGRINVNKLKEMGEYALITGATDGLGKAYAEFLASKGINIILVSRTLEKLNTVAEEIRSKFSVKTHIIQADFCNNLDIYTHIAKECHGFEIGILINNVGMSYPHPEFFLAAKPDLYENLIKCNIVSVNKMCEIIMPEMVQRKKGVVINISSTTAIIPSPLLTVYGATKAYVDKFSTDLAAEYSRHGIVVQCILPGFVATKMSKIRSSTWMAPSPKKFVSHAIKTVGVRDHTTGYYAHTLLVAVVNMVHSISPTLSRWFVLRTMENLRARALRRYMGNKYSVKTHVIQADFCGGPEIYKHIQKECAGYEIGILINNVGMSFSYPEFFLDVAKDDFYSKIINCNIVSVNKMCEIIMPEMVQRKKGVVINISSTSARVQSPLLTVYGATKAYVDKFSTDLAAEYARHGIIVQVVLPGFVATNMSKIRKPTWMAPSAKTFVKHAVNSIGVQEATTGYYPHTIMMTALHAIEAISPSFSRWFVLKTMGGLRARALKKLKQK